MSAEEKTKMIDKNNKNLSLRQQCKVLGFYISFLA